MNKGTVMLSQIKLYIQSLIPTFKEEKEWKSIIFATFVSFVLSMCFKDTMYIEKEGTRVGLIAIVISCIWIGIMNSVQKICVERSAIKKAQKSGLFVTSYIAAHVIYQLVLCLVQAIVMALVLGFLLDSPERSPVTGKFFIDLFLNIYILIFVSDMLGLVISSLARSTVSAIKIGIFVILAELLLSGISITMSDPAEKASNLMISKWGERALGVTINMNAVPSKLMEYEVDIIKNVDGVDDLLEVLPEEVIEKSRLGMEKFLYYNTYQDRYKYNRQLVVKRWLYLLAFAFCYIVLAGLCLKVIDYDRKARKRQPGRKITQKVEKQT